MREPEGIVVNEEDKGINGSFEKMLRRFKRKVIKEKVLYEFCQNQEYKKKSQRRHYRYYIKRCRLKYGQKDLGSE